MAWMMILYVLQLRMERVLVLTGSGTVPGVGLKGWWLDLFGLVCRAGCKTGRSVPGGVPRSECMVFDGCVVWVMGWLGCPSLGPAGSSQLVLWAFVWSWGRS